MATGSRSRKAPRRSGGGKFGGFVFALLLIGAIFAFYQIPVKPTITGFIETLQARSETVGQWARDWADGLLNWNPSPTPPTIPDAPEPGGDGNTGSASETITKLDALTVAPASNASYNRDEWKHWDDLTSCWNVREQTLVDEAVQDGTLVMLDKKKNPTTDISKACYVTAGTWIDPYTGATFTDPKELDIDHMIPLNYVAQHGGQAWNADKKEDYANNRDYPNHLIAVSASANRSKSDKGPSEWKPENQAYWCQYATDWVNISTTWKLTVAQADKDTLREMLNTCPA